MKKCIVCNKGYSKKIPDISFYRFPKDLNLKKQWLSACKLEEKDVHANTFICSRHFSISDFDYESRWPNKILFGNAVPYPPVKPLENQAMSKNLECASFSNTLRTENVPYNRSCTNVHPDLGVDNSTPKSETNTQQTRMPLPLPRYVGDLRVDHFSGPAATKRHLDLVFDTVKQKNKKIKMLQKQNERAEQKINNLNNLLKFFHKSHVMSVDAAEAFMEM